MSGNVTYQDLDAESVHDVLLENQMSNQLGNKSSHL
jgi:hypothetical protein